jgi:hypothetical protein
MLPERKADMGNRRSSALILLVATIFLAGCYDTVIAPRTNSIPESMITSPSEGQSYVEGDSVHFTGSGSDKEDGELADSSLTWISDKDGVLGTGGSFTRTDLSINTHVITLVAMDRRGSADSAMVTIHIDEAPPVKVLFIGSSHFAFNAQHEMFKALAESGGRDVITEAYTVGGAFLEYHASNPGTLEKINSQKWDFVLLQGSPAVMAFPYEHQYIFYPQVYHALKKPLMDLKAQVEANNPDAITVYCMPWAYEDGLTYIEGRTETYFDMQQLIYDNTLRFNEDIGLVVAPVGWAWRQIMIGGPELHYLFNPDWSHPSIRGSYLMACVFYSILFMEESNHCTYYADIPESEAQLFQFVASSMVLRYLDRWNR